MIVDQSSSPKILRLCSSNLFFNNKITTEITKKVLSKSPNWKYLPLFYIDAAFRDRSGCCFHCNATVDCKQLLSSGVLLIFYQHKPHKANVKH